MGDRALLFGNWVPRYGGNEQAYLELFAAKPR